MPLCQNKNDLKYCGSTLWDTTNKTANWTKMIFAKSVISKCPSSIQLNKTELENPHGQWIDVTNSPFYDSKIYNCLNRLDENPFEKVEAKPWLGNEICEKEDIDHLEYRRCLGQRSDTCINTSSKY